MASYKGKYPGPDIFKGNKKLIEEYNKRKKGLSAAARRKLAQSIGSKSTAKPAAKKPAAKPAQTAAQRAAAQRAAAAKAAATNKANTASNASGNIQLQSNHELDMEELDATQRWEQETAAANASERQAIINEGMAREDFRGKSLQDIGRLNASLAYRGLGGASDVATIKESELRGEQNKEETAIASELSNATSGAKTARETATARRDAALRAVTLGRQEYTNERSRDNPTYGSKPENTGVRAIVPGQKAPPKKLTAAQIAAARRKAAAAKKK